MYLLTTILLSWITYHNSSYAFVSFHAVFSGFAITEGKKTGERAPGDFGFNPGKVGKSEAQQKDYATKEIRNGRLAMWAAAGILLQGTVTDKGALEAFF